MPKFPFTNYHELNLDWILKKVNALFDASEENARTIRTYDSRLTSAEQIATSAATAATSAQQLADAAAANADNALSVAGTADAKADSALTAATDASGAVSGALTIAQEAQQTAGAAVAKANDAAATADSLESLANTANQNATAALETAQTADQKAVAAQTAAATADQKAVAAQTAATTNSGNITTLQTNVSNLNRQISEIDTDITNLETSINLINNKDINFAEFQNAGQRISLTSSQAIGNDITKISLVYYLSGSETSNTNMSIEISAYSESGTVLYESTPSPGNIILPTSMKTNGLIIAVHVKLIGNVAVTSYIIVDATTQSTKIISKQISRFSAKAKALRTCILWHYMTDSSGTCYYSLNGAGNWQLNILN